MLIQQDGNAVGVLHIVGLPQYHEKFPGKFEAECTIASAICKIQTTDGLITEDVELYFYDKYAMPAKGTIRIGMNILAFGRMRSAQYYKKRDGKNHLVKKMIVEFWMETTNDPFNFVQVMKTQMELITQEWLSRAGKIAEGIPQPEGDDRS